LGEKPSFSDLSTPFDRHFLLIAAASIMFLFIAILTAYYIPAAERLRDFSIIFLILILLGFLFWNRQAESSGKFLTSFIISIVGVYGISLVFAGLTKDLSILKWSILESDTLFPTAQLSLSPVLHGPPIIQAASSNAEKALEFFINIPGPIAEELGFRIFLWKIVQPAIGKLYGNIVQAVGFGALHFFAYGGSIVEVLVAVIIGLFLGFIYWRYKDVLSVALAHETYNLGVLFMRFMLLIP
jgi:membrane protease YdiL (CAAX protease family)